MAKDKSKTQGVGWGPIKILVNRLIKRIEALERRLGWYINQSSPVDVAGSLVFKGDWSPSPVADSNWPFPEEGNLVVDDKGWFWKVVGDGQDKDGKIWLDGDWIIYAGGGDGSLSTDWIQYRLPSIGVIPVPLTNPISDYFFTADEIITAEGTFYLLKNDKGTVPSSVQTITVPDNGTIWFPQDTLTNLLTVEETFLKGSERANLTVETNRNQSQIFTIEAYRCNAEGVPIDSGISGAPIGDLVDGLGQPVRVICELSSGLIELSNNKLTTIILTGVIKGNVTIFNGERIRYHISCTKPGTAGANQTVTLSFGPLASSNITTQIVE